MRIFKFVPTALLFSTCLTIAAAAAGDDPKPLPPLEGRSVRLAEGQFLCYVGWGTQNTTFRLGGHLARAENGKSSYLPSADLAASPKLGVGCRHSGYTFDFYSTDGAFAFRDEIQVDGALYNSIDYEQNTLLVGYSFAAVPHLLHVNPGLGYAKTSYTLGLYGEKYDTEYSGRESSSENGLVYLGVRGYLNHFMFAEYLLLRSVRPQSVFYLANQFGLHVYRRF